jgi:hypothetical protein
LKSAPSSSEAPTQPGLTGKTEENAEREKEMNPTNGIIEMYLMNEALTRARMPGPQAEAPRTAKRIAMKALRKQARQSGTL